MEILLEHTVKKQAAQIEAMMLKQDELLTAMRQLTLAPAAPEDQSVGGAGAHIDALGIRTRDGDVMVDNRKVNTKIVFNVFGKESTSHIGPEQIRELLTEALRLGPNIPAAAQIAILRAAALVFSDPRFPENITCFMPNQKGDTALVHGESGWEMQLVTFVLSPMVIKALDIIFDHQPFEKAEDFALIMREMANNEKKYISGSELRPILIRNKQLLNKVVDHLPVAGD